MPLLPNRFYPFRVLLQSQANMDFKNLYFLAFFGFFVFTNGVKLGEQFKDGRRVQSLKVADVHANIDWVVQPLDHFDELNDDTWLQRYFWNDSNYEAQGHGPIFIFLESSNDGYWVKEGAMMELCVEVKCIAFQLEPRFSGESWPINDTEIETLRYYLTIEQTLADFAHAIRAIKDQFSLQNNKVVLVGRGFNAFFAAAAREKFPHLVNAVWASSAILKPVYDFPEYFETVGRVIRDISQDCYDTIQEGFREIEKLAQNGEGCRKSETVHGGTRLDLPSDPMAPQGCPLIQHTFNLCQLLDFSTYLYEDHNDIRLLLETLAQDFATVVQANNQMGENSMENQCAKIFNDNSKGLSPLRKLAKFNQLMNELNGLSCTDFKMSSFCAQFRQTEKVQPTSSPMLFTGPRKYLWFLCSQFGGFQTSVQPFGTNFKVDFVGHRQCGCAFGKSKFTESRIQENIKTTVETYGGLALAKKTTKIAFIYGRNDPWSGLGVLDPEEASKSNLVIVMKGLSQSLDLNPSSADDPPVLTAGREEVKNQIKEWLGKSSHHNSSPEHSAHIDGDGNAEDEEFWRTWED